MKQYMRREVLKRVYEMLRGEWGEEENITNIGRGKGTKKAIKNNRGRDVLKRVYEMLREEWGVKGNTTNREKERRQRRQ